MQMRKLTPVQINVFKRKLVKSSQIDQCMFCSISFHVFFFMLHATKIVVVPDSSAAQKVPAVDGLLEYRKDKQELYVRSNKTWNVLAPEKVNSAYNSFFKSNDD